MRVSLAWEQQRQEGVWWARRYSFSQAWLPNWMSRKSLLFGLSYCEQRTCHASGPECEYRRNGYDKRISAPAGYDARLSAHPNDLTANLTELPENGRLRRHLPNDLSTRFLM
jgi:hypothetical protein